MIIEIRMDLYETTFRNWAETNRLRIKTKDKEAIIATSSRKYPLDHMFDGFKSGVGLYVSRPTRYRLTNLIIKLQKQGLPHRLRGDLEAIFFIPWDKVGVTPWFKRFVKRKGSNAHPTFKRTVCQA